MGCNRIGDCFRISIHGFHTDSEEWILIAEMESDDQCPPQTSVAERPDGEHPLGRPDAPLLASSQAVSTIRDGSGCLGAVEAQAHAGEPSQALQREQPHPRLDDTGQEDGAGQTGPCRQRDVQQAARPGQASRSEPYVRPIRPERLDLAEKLGKIALDPLGGNSELGTRSTNRLLASVSRPERPETAAATRQSEVGVRAEVEQDGLAVDLSVYDEAGQITPCDLPDPSSRLRGARRARSRRHAVALLRAGEVEVDAGLGPRQIRD